jgi:hypothetical protein
MNRFIFIFVFSLYISRFAGTVDSNINCSSFVFLCSYCGTADCTIGRSLCSLFRIGAVDFTIDRSLLLSFACTRGTVDCTIDRSLSLFLVLEQPSIARRGRLRLGSRRTVRNTAPYIFISADLIF